MDADIVQRVRELASPVAEEAAQEIERLRSALKVEQEQANRWWAMHLKAEADTAAECLRLKNKVRELEFDGKAKDEALISMRDSLREADAMFRERSKSVNAGEREPSPASTGSVAGEPLGWAVVNTDGVAVRFAGSFLTLANAATQVDEIVPLYRHPQPTLTDAEREAITVACGDSSQWGRPHVATLMRLLERTR